MPRADITIPETAVAIRLESSINETLDPALMGILARQMVVAIDLIELYAEPAPIPVKNECVIRIVGYLFESSPLDPGDAFAHSGARSLLAPYHEPQSTTVEKENRP